MVEFKQGWYKKGEETEGFAIEPMSDFLQRDLERADRRSQRHSKTYLVIFALPSKFYNNSDNNDCSNSLTGAPAVYLKAVIDVGYKHMISILLIWC